MAPRKRGIITMEEAVDSRAKAIRLAKKTKKTFKGRIPCRIDNNTIIYINAQKSREEQIERYINRLNKDRLNY